MHYVLVMNEQQLREQIAQDIEAKCCTIIHNAHPEICERMNFWYRHAASIARGYHHATPNDFYNRSCKESGHTYAFYSQGNRCIFCGDFEGTDEHDFQGKLYQDGDLIEAYCVVCKIKKNMLESKIRTSDSGRRMATGKCEQCGSKVNRILGKVVESGDY